MKRFFVAALCALIFTAVLSAQPRTIGVRALAGIEASYQHTLGANFLELDLGFLLNSSAQAGGFCITGNYNFPLVNDIFTINGLNFYAGPGVQFGRNSDKLILGVTGQAGLEYWLQHTPLVISLDWRPVLGFVSPGLYLGNVAVAFRYSF